MRNTTFWFCRVTALNANAVYVPMAWGLGAKKGAYMFCVSLHQRRKPDYEFIYKMIVIRFYQAPNTQSL